MGKKRGSLEHSFLYSLLIVATRRISIRRGVVLAPLPILLTLSLLPSLAPTASAQIVAFDMVSSASQNLVSFTDDPAIPFTSAGDGFQKFQREVSATIPFSVLDNSLSISPPDTLGIIGEANTDEFFGVVDTVNPNTGGTGGEVTATWVFDVSGATNLDLSIDMGAMGDFESSDSFRWNYSIDAGPTSNAFASSVDESASQTYVMDGGASVTLNDPMLVNGSLLNNNLATFTVPLTGSGSSLTLTLTAKFDGGSEAVAFQNIVIGGALAPSGPLAFDMVSSASQNLLSFTEDPAIPFGSAADGFNKFQRGVSATIPFAVADDSAGSFPPDTLGIIKTGNTDEFFGIVDTNNPDTGGRDVVATWVFDISGATNLDLSIDMGAMGDFEASPTTGDFFNWSYSIDGGPDMVAFASTVDESASQLYVMDSGTNVTLNDPMLVSGVVLTNDLTPFLTALTGTGSTLTLTLTANTNSGSEAIAFQNIVIGGALAPSGPLAFDMVSSASQNLLSFTEDPAIPFGSAADGFNKFQRGVSATIPFAVADDSAGSFPPDTLGIIKTGNTDEFFGIVDTNNPDTGGRDVVATWVFDISGATNLDLSIDMGAMGDFEASPTTGDFFNWSYSIDGGSDMVAFASTVDESASQLYVMDSGTNVTLNDPMLVSGVVLTNDLTPFLTALTGTGSTLTLTLTANTNGGSEAIAFQNIVIGEGDGPPPPPPPPELEIYEIQGAGLVSPFEGDIVTTRNNAVTCLTPDGFFMQTPEARSDGDIDTSDGILVFTGSPPSVNVGDRVDVTGEIDEFFGLTEFRSGSTVTIVDTGAIPLPVLFGATVPSPDPELPSCAIEYECYESMLVMVPEGIVGASNQEFGSDPFAEVHVTAGPMRPFREPGIEFPGLLGLPIWDGNPEVFELDPDKLGLPNQNIPAGSIFSAKGVIGFEFNHYELWPNELTVVPAALPVAVRATGPYELTVGSLNLFRLFDGDTLALSKLSPHILDVLRAPDILAVQEVDSLGVLQDLADQILADSAGEVDYAPYLEEGNDIGGIDVGFLVRQNIQVGSITQLGATELFTFDDPPSFLHDRPPLLLEGTSDGTFPIAVMVLHMRSLGGIEDPDGRTRQKRFEQAESIAQKVQDIQTGDPDVYLVVIGDFNAFEFTDGYVDVAGIIKGDFDPADSLVCSTSICIDMVEPNLTDELLSLPAEERYSFIFRDTFNPMGSRGDAQVLDHAMTTEALGALVQGFEYGRGNADAAEELVEDDGTLDDIRLRASDHDGLVLYIFKDEDQDTVPDEEDVCLGTEIPEGVPTRRLGTNRWALVDGDTNFDTTLPNGKGPGLSFTIEDTGGCSCEQIIEVKELGKGHSNFGCSIGAMQNWVALVGGGRGGG